MVEQQQQQQQESSPNKALKDSSKTATPIKASPIKQIASSSSSPQPGSTSSPNKALISAETSTIAEILASATSPTSAEDPLAPFIARWEAINNKRQKIMKQLEKHVQTTQRIYNLVDKNITTLDSATKPIHHLFPFPDEVRF